MLLAAAGWLVVPYIALADDLKSSNYQIQESFVGGGGLIDESSASFRASESIGDTAVGQSASANFQTNSSYTTTSDPALTFIVNNGTVNFGALSPATTTKATSSFRVINYTSYGYQIIIIGSSPSNGTHTIPALATPTSPAIGTEQYGINLVANSGFGLNPLQVPSVSFGNGIAQGPDYSASDMFKFVAGDVIASAPKSSGETDFTISHIINVSALTLGGQYSSNHELICIGTY